MRIILSTLAALLVTATAGAQDISVKVNGTEYQCHGANNPPPVFVVESLCRCEMTQEGAPQQHGNCNIGRPEMRGVQTRGVVKLTKLLSNGATTEVVLFTDTLSSMDNGLFQVCDVYTTRAETMQRRCDEKMESLAACRSL